MTKNELIARIAEKAGLTKAEAGKAFDGLIDTIEDVLVKEGKLVLTGFGSFKVEERKARVGRNPRTGEEMKIPATKVVKFSPGKGLKTAVAK